MCRNAIFVAWGPVHFVAYGFMFLLTLFLASLCLRSPWLINSAVPSHFAGGDRLSHRCRYPHYRTPLVTNTDSSPNAGPKSQLEQSEIQPLKLPSESYLKFLQLSPSPLSLFYSPPLPQALLPRWLNHSPPAAASAAGVGSGTVFSQSNVASCRGFVGDHATEQPLTDVNFICLFLVPSCSYCFSSQSWAA